MGPSADVSKASTSSASSQQPSKEEQSPPSSTPAPSSEAATSSEEEKPEECGWCRWMKGGGCKSEFEVWLGCVDSLRDAGREDVESCSAMMGPLWECMQKNSDYYSPQLESLKGRSPGGEKGSEKDKEAGGLVAVVEELQEDLQDFVEGFMDGDDVEIDLDDD